MNKTLIVILFIALILRISGALLFPAYSGGDEWMHYEMILHHSDLKYSEKILNYYSLNSLENYYSQTPIYYNIVYFFNDFSFNFYFIRLFQAILSVASIFVAFKLISLFWDEKPALYVSLFMAFLPSFIVQSATINPDILAFLFCFLMFYFLFRQLKESNIAFVVLSLCFFALALFTKLTSFWLFPTLMIGLTYSAFKNNKEIFNYLMIPLILIIWFFLHSLKLITYEGFNLQTIQFNLINLNELLRTFAGFFLQEYGTAILSDFRFAFFYFFLFCCFVLIYYALKKAIVFNAVNSLIAFSVISVFVGTFYISAFAIFSQGRYLFTILPFVPLIYYRIVENSFWRTALIVALVFFTGFLFVSIHYGLPICVPYAAPVCVKG